jgi:hypothetical protein
MSPSIEALLHFEGYIGIENAQSEYYCYQVCKVFIILFEPVFSQ